MTIDSSGDVGIGMIPVYQFQLSTAEGYKASGTTWQNPSDERLKEDIENANLDLCYDLLKQLPLDRYKWKDTTNTEGTSN